MSVTKNSRRWLLGLLALALCELGLVDFVATPAKATVTTTYVSSAEDVDYVCTGPAISVDTTSGRFRSGWARYALFMNSNSQLCKTQLFSSAISSFWFHAEIWNEGLSNTTNNQDVIQFLDASGIERFALRGTGNFEQVKLSKKNAAGTYTDLLTCPINTFPVTGLQAFDLQMVYAVSGSVKLYVNVGTGPVDIGCDFSGDVTTDGNSTLQQVGLSIPGPEHDYSEVFVVSSDSRSMGEQTCAPQSAGTNQNWTPNTVTNINPNAINDANSISTGTQPTTTEWIGPTPVAGLFTVIDVAQSARITRGASGPSTFEWVIRPTTAGSDTTSGTPLSLTTSFQNYFFDWGPNNPVTSVPWVQADLATNCGQAGLQSHT